MSETLSALDRAIAAASGQSRLAELLSQPGQRRVLSQHITNWKARGVPADRCAAIEALTGITCEQLRPDLDWRRDDAGNVTGHFVPAAKAAA